jgi:hypothetical protein
MKKISDGEIYTQAMHDELKRVLQEKATYVNKLPEQGTVFIDSSRIPKKEFKRLYPNFKYTTDPKLATISIVTDDNFYFPENWLKSHIGKPAKGGYVLRNMNDAIENYNVIVIGTLILDKHIKFNNDKEGLTPETAANIRRLLGSSDLETFKLGFSLLFNHDYEKEKDLFFLCLASANAHCWYRREKTILSRNIMSKIKFDFPNSKF